MPAKRITPLPLEFSADGLTARVPLRSPNGIVETYALIDANDADLVRETHWYLDEGYARSNGYANGKKIQERMHRVILGLTKDDPQLVDHINRDRLDNRRANLRLFDRHGRPDMQNISGWGKSQHRGVSFDRDSGKWHAYIYIQGRMRNLGRFDSESEATKAARDARLRLMPYATD